MHPVLLGFPTLDKVILTGVDPELVKEMHQWAESNQYDPATDPNTPGLSSADATKNVTEAIKKTSTPPSSNQNVSGQVKDPSAPTVPQVPPTGPQVPPTGSQVLQRSDLK